MARSLRIAFPGALYHITVRGNEQKNIFRTNQDRHHLLRLLSKTISRFQWSCFAYCLMDNHFHILLETREANISQGMKFLNGVFTQYFNWRHKRVGHLFQGRFHAILVEKESHFLEVCRYVPLNPVRAGMCEHPKDFEWSSYRATAGLCPAPSFLNVEAIWERFHENIELARKAYETYVLQGIDDRPFDKVRGRIFLGSDAFIEKFQDLGWRKRKGIPVQQTRVLRPALKGLLAEKNGWLKAYECGYSAREIAELSGVHQTTVSRQLKRLRAGVKSDFEANA